MKAVFCTRHFAVKSNSAGCRLARQFVARRATERPALFALSGLPCRTTSKIHIGDPGARADVHSRGACRPENFEWRRRKIVQQLLA